MVATTSVPLTVPAMSLAPWPPAATSCSTLAGLRLYPVTSKLAVTRLAATGSPMMPSPMNPIFVVMNSPPESARLAAACLAACAGPGQPGQAGLGCPGGLVLQAYPAPVAAAGQGGQVPVQVELAAAGLAASRRVGDLHVRDVLGVPGDRGVDVVAVAGQVVQVAEEADVGGARGPGSRDDGHRVRRGAQRIGLRPADRLDQHRAAEGATAFAASPMLSAASSSGAPGPRRRPGSRTAR